MASRRRPSPARLYAAHLAPLALGLALVAAQPALAGEQPAKTLGPADRSGLNLVLYQDDTALVRDRREVALEKGLSQLVWQGVARQARPGSGILSGANMVVHAQGFDEGSTGDSLLAGAVGREVGVVWDGDPQVQRARVLAAGPTPLFAVDGKVVAGRPARIVYDAPPEGLRPGPAFTAAVNATQPGRREVELAYMTGGLGWQADYVAELQPTGDLLTLSAWTTLTNTSGIDFPEAKVSLVSGRPNRVFEPRRGMAMGSAAAQAPADMPDREAVGPYQLYTLPETISLADGGRTQATLLPPTAVKVERDLVLEPLPPHAWRTRYGEPLRQNPVALLRLDNSKSAGLGQPLPAGTIRIYQRAKDGGLVFLGEDRIPALPEHNITRVTIGQAVDVVGKRTQTDFQHVSADVSEAAYELELSNAGDHAAMVTVRESFGADWLVLEESEAHHREDAFSASWLVKVPAKGQATLKYRVRVKG